MTKRTVEETLRQELARALADQDKALARRLSAGKAVLDAQEAERTLDRLADTARERVQRVQYALEALSPSSTLAELVGQATKRAETTGTHDPADFVETVEETVTETTTETVTDEVVSPKRARKP